MAVSSTSFKPGNRANPAGRPSEYSIDEMADKLFEWSLKESSYMLTEFTDQNDLSLQKLSFWANKDSRFRETLEIVKARIACRRERYVHLDKLEPSVFRQYQRMYDYMLNEHHREELAYEYDLKAKSTQQSIEMDEEYRSQVREKLEKQRNVVKE